jgi:flagellar hook-associated protein 1 FlgK
MSGFSSLEIGKKALLAQRFGLDVTSNNIANVNTPGYSRRVAVMAEDTSIRKNGFFMGNSVVVQKIQTFRNEYYDKEIRNNESKKAAFDVDSQFLKRVETILGEPNGDSIDKSLNEFFKAFDQVANNTESVPFRSFVLEKGQELTEKFNNTALSLDDLRSETLTGIKSNVDAINIILKDISELNKLSSYNINKDGDSSQQYADQRENKIQELSKLIDIKVASNEDTSVNIFMNGINLVSGVYYSEINYKMTTDPATNEITANIYKRDIDTGVETQLEAQSGAIFSNLKMHNELLDPLDSSGNFSVAKELNNFVNAFATKINELFVTGFGLEDTDPLSPPRRYLFEPYDSSSGTPSAGISASNIRVNNSLLQNPKDVPLSSKAGEPGNSDIARSVAKLSNDKTFYGNMSPIEYYSNYISKIGSAARTSVDGISTTKLIDEQLNTQRESLMGVNLDEEAINLIKFQKGFEAASRIISITNELLSTLINLGR